MTEKDRKDIAAAKQIGSSGAIEFLKMAINDFENRITSLQMLVDMLEEKKQNGDWSPDQFEKNVHYFVQSIIRGNRD